MSSTYDTFIIKISNETPARPRGSIQHVASQEMKRFEGFDVMNNFISQHITLSGKRNDLKRADSD